MMIVCSPSVYFYHGWKFEIHSYSGPCPLKANDEPYTNIPSKFWNIWENFDRLTKQEKDKYKIYWGGCKYI